LLLLLKENKNMFLTTTMKDILQNVKRWGIADANNNNKQNTAAELKFISSKTCWHFAQGKIN